MSRSTRQKQRANRTMARPKSRFFSPWQAWRDLERENPMLLVQGTPVPDHTGTYWRWQILPDDTRGLPAREVMVARAHRWPE